MKFLFATIIVAAIGVSAIPNPQTDATDGRICLAVCQVVKPVCPVGEAPTGSEGCWGCCQPSPILRPCTKECRFEKPVCPVGEAPTGGEGCWGCCQPIPCTLQCRFEKPVCPVGEAPTGSEGCWGCCQPINTF